MGRHSAACARSSTLPKGSNRAGVREAGRGTPSDDTAEEIRTFLIADVRGYMKGPSRSVDEREGALRAPAPLVERAHELADREVADPAAVLDPLLDGVAEVEADEDA
jgi:hypothetical protein